MTGEWWRRLWRLMPKANRKYHIVGECAMLCLASLERAKPKNLR